MKVLATFNIKGGVGKTSCAVNLAYEASASGARALLWDLDPQGAATFLCRIKPVVKGGAARLAGRKGELAPHIRATDFPALHAVPADVSLRYLDGHLDNNNGKDRIATLLEPLAERYDVVVLDCPPGISRATDSVLRATDALLVPVIPAPLSARTLEQLGDFLAQRADQPTLLPYVSMFDPRNKLHADAAAYLRGHWPGLLGTAIPQASLIERMGIERAPVGASASGTAAAVAYRRLWDEVAARLWA